MRPRELWRGKLAALALIVPSPMTAVYGVTQEGKRSKHTLANTGPRRYLVCDFDQGTPDEHATILNHLGQTAPFVMAVHSGGKSLHGWFIDKNLLFGRPLVLSAPRVNTILDRHPPAEHRFSRPRSDFSILILKRAQGT